MTNLERIEARFNRSFDLFWGEQNGTTLFDDLRGLMRDHAALQVETDRFREEVADLKADVAAAEAWLRDVFRTDDAAQLGETYGPSVAHSGLPVHGSTDLSSTMCLENAGAAERT